MNLLGRCTGCSIVGMALPLLAQFGTTPSKVERFNPPSKSATGRMTDAQAAELAKGALTAENPASIRAMLARLKGHSFKSSKAPERELVLYAQGTLEARLGNVSAAIVAFKKLERQWPRSPFMGEAQPAARAPAHHAAKAPRPPKSAAPKVAAVKSAAPAKPAPAKKPAKGGWVDPFAQ